MTLLQEFPPSPLCSSCGMCCKKMPGAFIPSDFLDLESEIKALLSSGKYSIDWWEGDEKGEYSQLYYLRPATKKDQGKIFDPSWGGECVFLSPNGCSLTRSAMPSECKALKPGKDECKSVFGKQQVAEAWRPFQDILESLGKSCLRQET